jgi:hypothetical protein
MRQPILTTQTENVAVTACHTRDVDDCSASLHKRDCILDPQERAAEQKADRSIESFYGRSGDRATLTTYSGVIQPTREFGSCSGSVK